MKTFGVLKFSALRREVHIQNEGRYGFRRNQERTYDLKQGTGTHDTGKYSCHCSVKGDYNAEVKS